MRTLIVDDQPGDRLVLASLLKDCPGVQVLGEAGSLSSARKLLESLDIELIFLDVELGRENGFDLIKHLSPLPQVVFTTVHSHLGSEAFDANAADYIVKPVTQDRLLRSIARIEARLGLALPQPIRVPVHRGGSERHFLGIETISAVIAERDYSRVISGSQEYPDHRRIREWEQILADLGFERLDRSTLLRPDQCLACQPFGIGARVSFRNSPLVIEIGRVAFQRLQAYLEPHDHSSSKASHSK